jgi:hypothetical protein
MRLLGSIRALAVVLLVAVALGVAGCGGGAADVGSVEGAGLVGSDAAVFVSLNIDFDSEQWQAVEALISRFPGGEQALSSLLEKLGAPGLDFEQDVKPALGPETNVVVLELSDKLGSAENAPIVLFTQPRDRSRLEALLAEGTDKAVLRELGDGWVAVADNQAIIDRALEAANSSPLAEDPRFNEAMDELPEEAVATVYLNGNNLADAFTRRLTGAGQTLGSLAIGAGAPDSIAIAATAEEEGVRLHGVARSQDAPAVDPYQATLPAVAPSGTLLFASFANARQAVEQLLELAAEQEPSLDQQLGQMQLALGVSLEDDVLPLFEGEHALYVRAALPVPEITLLLSPADPRKGLATLDAITSAVGSLAGLSGEEAPFQVTSKSIAGIPAKRLTLPRRDLSLYYALVGGKIAVTTQVEGIADLATSSKHLADDAIFTEAMDAAGVSGESLGFVYVDLKGAISSFERPETTRKLGPLRYLVVQAAGGGEEITLSGFLAVG